MVIAGKYLVNVKTIRSIVATTVFNPFRGFSHERGQRLRRGRRRGGGPTLPIAAALAVVAILSPGHPRARAATDDGLAAQLRLLQAADARVARIGWQLKAANVALCPETRPELGIMLYDAAQFAPEVRSVAGDLFGLAAPVAVSVVVPDGPGDRAGLRPGDGIVAIDGGPLPRKLPAAQATFDGVEAALALLDRASSEAAARARPVTLRVARGAGEVDIALDPRPVCAAFVQLLPDPRSEASADARTISVSTGLLDRVANDDELAFLIGHELAHIMLGHRERFARARVDKGLFAGFGRNGAILRAAEADADRLGIVLSARAGYDVFAPAAFWRRAGRAAAPLIGDGTHPGWRTRARDADAISAAIAANREDAMPPDDLRAQLVDRRRQLDAKMKAFDR
ncbi:MULTISPECIES: M48 family metalloprotease [unclassified Sphingomonas]|jgi:hypothetical protein|uniref:M48 family metalloprotease n=1 Tax=unclassified Sphingomonas TaxID=196159 RepID=UPI000832131A|nr:MULTISPECIES: M48 family metalloprotease [unclassified Sphingomonas]